MTRWRSLASREKVGLGLSVTPPSAAGKKKVFLYTDGCFDSLVYPIVEMEHMQREDCEVSLRSLK